MAEGNIEKDEIDVALAEFDGLDDDGVPDVFSSEFATIPPSAITEVSRTNTRKKLSGEEFETLRQSIAANGIQNPLHVEEKGDGTYILHAGRRRLKVATELGMKIVPVMVVDPSQQRVELVSAIENLIRYPYEPLEEAKAYKVLIKDHDLTQEKLGTLLGLPQSRISEKLSLLKASPKDKKDLTKGKRKEKDVRDSVKKKSGVVNVPEDALPEGMKVSIHSAKIKISLSFDGESDNPIGKEVKRALGHFFKNVNVEKLTSAYKAAAREVKGE